MIKFILKHLEANKHDFEAIPKIIRHDMLNCYTCVDFSDDESDWADIACSTWFGLTGAKWDGTRLAIYFKYDEFGGHDYVSDFIVFLPHELKDIAKYYGYKPEYLKLEVDNGKKKSRDYWDRKRDNPTRNGLKLVA